MINLDEPPILCVDDTEEQRYVTVRILRSAGYRVIEAATGFEALKMMSQEPLAVVLDVNLPDMSGYEVCRRIRLDPQVSSTPVLQVSASFTDPEQRAVSLSGGADASILQPYHREELIALVRVLVRSRRSEEILRLMSEASVKLSRSLDYAMTLETVLTTLVPKFADRCFVMTTPGGWQDENEVPDYIRDAAQCLPPSETSAGVNGGTQVSDRFPAILTPLAVGGERTGLLAFVLSGQDRVYTASDLAIAQDFGSRSALALQNASLYTAQRLAQDALVRSEKLAAAGRMAASMAHEINNPLEALTNLVYLISLISTSNTLSADNRGYAEEALQELARLAQLTRQTLGFYQELTNPVVFALADSVNEVVSVYQPKLKQKGINIERNFATAGEMVGIKGEIRQVISNLLLNAIDAMQWGGSLTFQITEDDRGVLVLRAHDNGSGIPTKYLQEIFEPFFTTKEGIGTGLGLWVSNNIIRKHGGTIQVESSTAVNASGTTFVVRLPVSSPVEQQARSLADASACT